MALDRDWWRRDRSPRTTLLLPLAWLFGLLAATRHALYRVGLFGSTRVAVPVVVVGNLTVGGSGKTPLVICLAQMLAARGLHAGVISRGYARDDATPREVRTDSAPTEVGDEPLLIKRRAGVPVFVGRDRVAAARALLNAHADVDVLLADDGLQHLALARDFEIAVFDERGAGNRCLLPAGPLRESLHRAATVDALVFNGDARLDLPGFTMRLEPDALYRLVDATQRVPVAAIGQLEGVAAVAGIGNPARFFATLRGLGLAFSEHAFPDHHAFTREDLVQIEAEHIVMTEKDALKCAGFGDPRIWVLPVSAAVDMRLVDSIMEKLRGRQAA